MGGADATVLDGGNGEVVGENGAGTGRGAVGSEVGARRIGVAGAGVDGGDSPLGEPPTPGGGGTVMRRWSAAGVRAVRGD